MKRRRTLQHLALLGLALLGWGLLASPLLHSLEHALGRRHSHHGSRHADRGPVLGRPTPEAPWGLVAANEPWLRHERLREHGHEHAHHHDGAQRPDSAPHEHGHEHGHADPLGQDDGHAHAHHHDGAPRPDRAPREDEHGHEHGHEREPSSDERPDSHGAGSFGHLMLAGLEAPPLPWPALARVTVAPAPVADTSALALAARHRPEQPQGP